MRSIAAMMLVLILAGCSIDPAIPTRSLWAEFEGRCLAPVLLGQPPLVSDLKEAAVEPQFFLAPPSQEGMKTTTYAPGSGDWHLEVVTFSDNLGCLLVSPHHDTASHEAARTWAVSAVDHNGFQFNHHDSSRLQKVTDRFGFEVSFGDIMNGVDEGPVTAFLVGREEVPGE